MTELALPVGGAPVHADERVGAPSAADAALIDLVLAFVAYWRVSLLAISLVTIAVALGWKNQAPAALLAGWCAAACLNYAGQGWLYRRIQRAGRSLDTIAACMPWVTASVGCSGLLWGAVPWLLTAPSAPAMLLACAFNLMLFFCAANTPVTRGMLTCAIVTACVPTSLAPVWRLGLGYASLGCVVGFGLIYAYSVRLGDAIFAVFRQRRVADSLAAELQHRQAQLVESERQRAILLERQRLMRDMHDVVGGGLTASLVAVENGEARPQALADMLRECLVDLRLIIDSLEPAELDVVGLLAALRFRMSDRLAAAGVTLDWQMHDLPAVPWLGPSEALQLLRVVQELLTNAIKHAGARCIRVEAQPRGGTLRIRVSDDGCGFDVVCAASGRGLRFMAQRIAALRGRIEVDSWPGGGTRVELQLPLDG
ncbi:sensor histidine kinase [Ideonella sp.]|uniref:sensor histidine kinase n=1 Tax=Ideonella sp. TaxID=1929293 RepID=UPI0035B06F75